MRLPHIFLKRLVSSLAKGSTEVKPHTLEMRYFAILPKCFDARIRSDWMQPVRIAMLGSGFVADFYMQALADVPGQEVVANYSRSVERAGSFSRHWKIPSFTTDMDELIARDDV